MGRAISRACWLQDGFVRAKLGPRWPMSAPRLAQDGFQMCLPGLFGLILGSSWAVMGPPWPFLRGPGGHLEASIGLWRASVGMVHGKKAGCQKPLNNKGKSMILCNLSGRGAFRKPAKFTFGSLVVVLRAWAEQFQGLVGFKMGLYGPS